jgi:hypothetical protein
MSTEEIDPARLMASASTKKPCMDRAVQAGRYFATFRIGGYMAPTLTVSWLLRGGRDVKTNPAPVKARPKAAALRKRNNLACFMNVVLPWRAKLTSPDAA